MELVQVVLAILASGGTDEVRFVPADDEGQVNRAIQQMNHL